MAKFEVTPELAAILRASRAQYGLTAKEVAEHVGKSQSFISRLEKADLKTIKETDLTNILSYIYSKDKDGNGDLDSVLEKVYKTVQLYLSDNEIENQLWWDNYDTVYRTIPVPTELIQDIQTRLNNLHLSVSDLCQRINANEGIKPIENSDQYPFNLWTAKVVNHKLDFYFIKMHVSVKTINSILSREKTGTNYVTMLAISYYLNKIERFGSFVDISEDNNRTIMKEAKAYLNKYKFFSITEKSKLAQKNDSKEWQDSLLSSFDLENAERINDLINAYKVFAELDIEKCNRNLDIFVKNMQWDIGFMTSLTGINFYQFESISYTNKRKMLSEIRDTVKKYESMPEEKLKAENYDW